MTMPTDTPDDARLVAAALSGDRSAFAAIYDAYADRIHTMCVHMLGDRDEAADVCGEVFLVAFQRLSQLRDPSRLRPWLFAICRHEVYRRTKRLGRVELVGEVTDMDRHIDSDSDFSEAGAVDAAALALVVGEAAAGLDDRDRMVLELQLQGLDGADLADALGTSVSTSYQHVHRMRERMERSLGALLIARQGRKDCADLDRVLAGWDGSFSILWRKRVARHVDECDVCDRRRKSIPGTLLGTAGASPLVAAPTSVRTRVLEAVSNGSVPVAAMHRGRWRDDGFPPDDSTPSRRGVGIGVAAAILVLLAGVLALSLRVNDPVDITIRSSPTATAIATTQPQTVPSTTPSTELTEPSTTSPSTVPVASTSTEAPRPSTSRAPLATTTPLPTTTTTTAVTTTTTSVPSVPTLRLSGPSLLYARTADGAACSNESYVATITSKEVPTTVTLRWTLGANSGTVAMTRSLRVASRWTATVDLPYGSQGTVTVVASATTGGGGVGDSNTLIAIANPCPIIR